MGLPGIQGHDKERVAANNAAAESVLGESRCINPGAVLLGEKIQGTVCTDAHLQKGACPSKVYGGMNTTMLIHFKGQERRSNVVVMTSKKSGFGQTCAAGTGITCRDGRPE